MCLLFKFKKFKFIRKFGTLQINTTMSLLLSKSMMEDPQTTVTGRKSFAPARRYRWLSTASWWRRDRMVAAEMEWWRPELGLGLRGLQDFGTRREYGSLTRRLSTHNTCFIDMAILVPPIYFLNYSLKVGIKPPYNSLYLTIRSYTK